MSANGAGWITYHIRRDSTTATGACLEPNPASRLRSDTLNRLTNALVNGSTVFTAAYDYRTRRLTKDEGTATYFRYDSGDSFQETTSGVAPSINVEFVRGSGMGGGIGSILYSDRRPALGPIEHFTYNAVGHTVAMTDVAGAPTKTDLYEAFGNITSSSGTSTNNRLANTKERDFSLGLDNHGHRYFDPEIGRYISRDPIGYGDGLNVYLYVHNNPINHIDPLGLGLYDEGNVQAQVLRRISQALDKVGTSSNSSILLRNPVSQAILGAVGNLADLGANLNTPKTFVEGYKAQVENTANVIYHAQQAGANPVAAASQGLGYAAGNLIGYTPLAEAITGVDIAAGENISGMDRAQRGLMGGGQLLLTGTGLVGSYNPALQSGRLALSQAAPEATVTRYMSEGEAREALDTGNIPNYGKDGSSGNRVE